jgi:hypothetical protein
MQESEMKLYKIDQNRIYTGDTEIPYDGLKKVPKGYIYTDREPSEGIQQWQTDHWVTLEEYPEKPVRSPAVTYYSKLALIDQIDNLGQLEDFNSLLESNLKLKLRWMAAQQLSSDDPDFIGLQEILKDRWDLSQSDINSILEQCLI